MIPTHARYIPIEGTLNVRDLGGYATSDGRVVVSGRVFRADMFANLTDRGVEQFAELGVEVVFDFRHDGEVTASPNRLPEGVQYRRLPIGGAAVQADLIDRIIAGEYSQFSVSDMIELYQQMLEESWAQFGGLITGLAENPEAVAIFHCTAGKDRTGIGAALILDVLDVPAETIVADYHLTDIYRTPHRIEVVNARFKDAGIDPTPFRAMFSAPPEVMEATVQHLHHRYGGAEAYLIDVAGVSPMAIDNMRSSLLGVKV